MEISNMRHNSSNDTMKKILSSRLFSNRNENLVFRQSLNIPRNYDPKVKAALKKFAVSESSGQQPQEEGYVPQLSARDASKQDKSRRETPREVLDPFAVKVSIPPLVLLTYVVWTYYSAEDPRLKSIREAEEKHAQYMSDLAEEKNGVAALHAFNSSRDVLVIMGLSILHIVEAALLGGNAMAILNEKRFLRKYSLDKPTFEPGPRNQLATFLYAVRNYMQIPLIVLNVVVVLLEVLIG